MRKSSVSFMAAVALAATVVGANAPAAGGTPSTADLAVTTVPRVEGLPGDTRLNEIQVMGTHNSYHLAPPETMVFYDDRALDRQITQSPLDVQLGQEGVRKLEIDVYADSQGGRWADPDGVGFPYGGPQPGPEMDDPGFKVLHDPDWDYLSNCTTFVRCLETVEQWSDANPRHIPVMILVEIKTGSGAEPVSAAQVEDLEGEVRSVFAESDLITPDFVRGAASTLAQARTTTGWPTLDATAGRVLLALDNAGTVRDLYEDGDTSLHGRAMFTDNTAGMFLKMNEPDVTAPSIADRVRQGYVVRTRADGGNTARSNSIPGADRALRDLAFASGAQWVSTDFPVPGRPNYWGTDFSAPLPGGGVVRCNPVVAPSCNAPDNDDFAAPVTMTGGSGTLSGTNVDATVESREPRHNGVGQASVWFRWTAPRSGLARVDTFGSNFDTVLAVYTGDLLHRLALVKSNSNSGGTTQSQVAFIAEAGRTYRVAVAGSPLTTGAVVLHWGLVQAVANDAFAAPATLTGTSGTIEGSNYRATVEAREPRHNGVGQASVWYQWTAPRSAPARIDTFGSNFDTIVAVYTGDLVHRLAAVKSNNNAGGTVQSQVSFAAVAGRTYRIAVAGNPTTTGDITLHWAG